MPNSIQILLFESNAEVRKQITNSLMVNGLPYQIREVTETELESLSSPDSPYAIVIFSATEPSPELLLTLLDTNNLDLICLLETREFNGDVLKIINENEIPTVLKKPTEIERLNAVVKNILERRNHKIFIEYLFKENTTSHIGKLLTGFAHNISAPLTGILGYAEIVRSTHPELVEIQNIISQARRIDTIIRTIVLKNMRLEEKQKTQIDLNELIKTEMNFLQSNLVFKHEVSKKIEFADNLPKFTASYSDISQIVCSLLNFCTVATENLTSKSMTVKTSSDQNFVILVIEYRGCPFPNAELARIVHSKDIFSTFLLAEQSESWLKQNYTICLAYFKLISLGARVETGQNVAGDEIITIKFRQNFN